MASQYTLAEFGQRIKAKYPQYKDIPDAELASKVISKYPQYKSAIVPSINPEARTAGNYGREITRGVGRGLKDDILGLWQTAMHPIDTATGLVKQGTNAVNAATKEFQDTSAAPMSQRLGAGALTFLENAPMIGGMVQHAEQGGDKIASPESAGAAAEAITAILAPDVTARLPLGEAARKGAEIVSGKNRRVVDDLVRKTREANAKEEARAANENATIRSKRTEEINKHFEALQKAKGEEPTSRESGRPRNARELQSHKEALNRGVKKLNTDLQKGLKETAKRVKSQADEKYAQVRAALGPKELPDGNVEPAPTVDGSNLADAVKSAEGRLEGSSENIKIFRDILSKSAESDPDFIESPSEGKVPRGHPIYDVLREMQKEGKPEGFTFSDLQGYYTELGDKLSTGRMPGDVYQAVKQLHDSIGIMMDNMAKNAGVLDQLKDAQQFYRGYMQTFREPTSPLYKAIKEPESTATIKHLMGKDQSGIQALAKYDPELTRKANTIRAYKQEADSIRSTGTKAPKEERKLGPRTTEVVPVKKTVGPENIRAANEEAIRHRAAKILYWSDRVALWASGYRALGAIGRAAGGDPAALAELPPDIGEGIALIVGGHALATLLENPKISKMLANPSAAQLAAITPDVADGLKPIIQQAKSQGIKVSPALIVALAGAGNQSWYNKK